MFFFPPYEVREQEKSNSAASELYGPRHPNLCCRPRSNLGPRSRSTRGNHL